MTKTLEQIQEENRKLIIEAIHGCSYEEIVHEEEIMKMASASYNDYAYQNYGVNFDDDDDDDTIVDKPITLSRVLLAFKNKEVKSIYKDEIIFDIGSSKFCGLKLEEEYHNPHYSLYGAGNWNLEIETLEEQSEETQRVINQLLTGE